MPLLAAFLWFAQPAPLDMPAAVSDIVRDADGTQWLEDRYDEFELWTFRSVISQWMCEDGRYLSICRLDSAPPLEDGRYVTRERFRDERRPIPLKDRELRECAIAALSPFELPEKPRRPWQEIRGLKETLYYEGTNTSAIVCAVLPEQSDCWYLAIWSLYEQDDVEAARKLFEKEFLTQWRECLARGVRSETGAKAPEPRKPDKAPKKRSRERKFHCEDALHSVTNYPNWHATVAPEFVILDDLPPTDGAVSALTNELSVMRRKYAATLPSPINGSNVLSVARIFKTRSEFVASVAENDGEVKDWVAGFWDPVKREIVAYLPPTDDESARFLKLFRHEAFHQYLSYACGMLPPSPWINEGYAVYFEDEDDLDWKIDVDLEALEKLLPALLFMSQSEFCEGSDLEVHLKYRMAWSVACFLEKGAPNVRFQPFKNLKADYIKALLKYHDPKKATSAAFGSKENLEHFVSEWKKFWKDM